MKLISRLPISSPTKRAPTPSAAAELVAAREDQICSAIEQMGQNLTRLMRYKMVNARAARPGAAPCRKCLMKCAVDCATPYDATNTAQHRLQIEANRTLRTLRIGPRL